MKRNISHFIHTDHSKENGTSKVKEYVSEALNNSVDSLIIVDNDSIGMAVSLFKESKKQGIKPIIGVNLRLTTDDIFSEESDVVLVAKNDDGYREIKNLISEAYMFGQSKLWKKNPNITKAEEKLNEEYRKTNSVLRPLIQYKNIPQNDNLFICFGSNDDFLININKDYDKPKKILTDIKNENVFISLSILGKKDENIKNNLKIKLAKDLDIKVIINQDVKFSKEEMFNTHELKSAILTSNMFNSLNRSDNATPYQYLMNKEKIEDLYEDYTEALDNTSKFSNDCNVEIEIGTNYLPKFDVPYPFENLSEIEYLKKTSLEGMIKKLKIDYPESWPEKQSNYNERLNFELSIIENMGFPGYFLIVADFIYASKDMGVPVGPGRGSGAGSLVAYGLDITDIDPIKYQLFFERFLNPERVSMPDFDIDFSKSVFKEIEKEDYLYEKYGIPLSQHKIGRDDVISYVAKKYNNPENKYMSVTQIITEGKLGGKGAIKDAGRALGLSLPYIESLIKEFKDEQGISIQDMLNMSLTLKDKAKEEPILFNLIESAKKLEGRKKSSGVHAGGVIIAPDEITKFSPIQCEPDGSKVVSQFDKDYSEDVGLVKFDFLGLETLTIIDTAVKYIKEMTGKLVDIRNIPLDDSKSFALLQSTQTKNIFQLESSGMRDLIRRLQPTDFSEISALVALFRPGPLESGMADSFVEGKFDKTKIEVYHEDLNDILKETYGSMIYQEQVQQAAQKLAGYTLGAADELRRAMGKKKPEEMAKHKKIFIQKAGENYREKTITNLGLDIFLKDIDNIKNIKETGYIFSTQDQLELLFSNLKLKDKTLFFEEINDTNEEQFVLSWESDIKKELNKIFSDNNSLRILECVKNYIRFNYIFSSIEKFAAYGFNKSHSVSYAKVTYQTLYLKSNHPVEYMSAELSSNMNKTEKIGEIIQEVRRMKIKILPPDINKSELEFRPEIINNNVMAIRYGLGAIKGLGEKDIEKISLEKINGDFKDYNDFYVRVGHKLNKGSKEVIAYSGLLDVFMKTHHNREDILQEMLTDYSFKKIIINFYEENKNDLENKNLINTFEKIKALDLNKKLTKPDLLILQNNNCLPIRDIANTVQNFSEKYKLSLEYKLLGAYISNHPLYINGNIDAVKKIAKAAKTKITSLKELPSEGEDLIIAGVIMGVREFVIKKEGSNQGKIIAKIEIDDAFGQTGVTMFPDEYSAYKDLMVIGNVVAFKVDTKTDDFGLSASCFELMAIDPKTKVQSLGKTKKRKYTKKNKKNNLYASMKKINN